MKREILFLSSAPRVFNLLALQFCNSLTHGHLQHRSKHPGNFHSAAAADLIHQHFLHKQQAEVFITEEKIA